MLSLSPLTTKRLEALEAAVTGQIENPDPRVVQVLTSVIRHAHGFVREVRPTPREWAAAVDFLVRVGQTCTDQRNELILLLDMLGLTSAVDEVNFPGIDGATPSSVEGPFHSAAPSRSNGDWLATGPERGRGERMLLRGRVTDVGDRAIANATVDVWQADDAGRYDSQDSRQPDGNLRGVFTTGADGRFWFRSVVPSSYPVPTDGPAGELLRAMGRHPMRPAHIHVHVTAAGFRPLTTHVFVAGDQYLDSDAAFAVKPELVFHPVRTQDPALATRYGLDGPCALFDVHLRLVAAAQDEGSR
jgi:catechol 1,2-dioxygenase